jgi:putative ABC transport system substrate-binding protein
MRFIQLGRCEFITILGGMAAWPLAGWAQQAPPGKWRIGLMMQERPKDRILLGLRKLGYVEGQNLFIEVRSIDRADQLAAFATELVGLRLDVIVVAGTQATRALQQVTKVIPIVMTGSSDPVGTGLVASLARPGGNITGLSLLAPELSGKRLELLREVTGRLSELVVLWNSDDPPAANSLKETQNSARAAGLESIPVAVRSPDDFEPAFKAIAKAHPSAVVILPSPLMQNNLARIAELALGLQLPSIYPDQTFPQKGGLMSYGPNFLATAQQAVLYVDKVLKGAKPADLPVEQPTKFDLVINLKTAKALGIEVSPTFIARADEVIE